MSDSRKSLDMLREYYIFNSMGDSNGVLFGRMIDLISLLVSKLEKIEERLSGLEKLEDQKGEKNE